MQSLKIFNTYTNSLEEFIPHHLNHVSIYVCGPTVYNYIHIGNARPVVFFDVVRRYFESKGYFVKFVSNFTDVDDNIIEKAQAENVSELEISNRYIKAFLNDVESLGSKTDYIKPKVTEYMDEIISYINDLILTGFAYEVEGDVYFRVSKISEYGKLSNRKLDDLISGARIEINPLKENPLDFNLWKKTSKGINWDSPFSQGRPGWHTECVAMIEDLFGEEIDIHGGGSDLIFPHHENEIAHSFAKHNHNVAKYWMHNGRLNLETEKMSKSLGNVIFVKDLTVNKMAFRLFILSTHYRAPLNFNYDNLLSVEKEWIKLENTVKSLFRKIELHSDDKPLTNVSSEEINKFLQDFDEAMELDFNTPNAITALQALIKYCNILLREKANITLLKSALSACQFMLNILGLSVELTLLCEEDKQLLSRWKEARKMKDFALADKLREELTLRNLI